MIKNVVFDLGRVMVRFEREYMVDPYVDNQEDIQLLEFIVTDRTYWDRLDKGTITDEEVVADCKRRLPERLWQTVEKIYYNWIYNIPEIEGMSDVVRKVKNEYGKRVFLLSNISTYFAEHAAEVPCTALFEKCIYSAVCGMVKPDREIFEHLCAECGILPEETLFIDDSPKNIEGAQAFGIKGYLFDGDVAKLGAYLETQLKE
jgi:putative hydrolase of the HAD superfamily